MKKFCLLRGDQCFQYLSDVYETASQKMKTGHKLSLSGRLGMSHTLPLCGSSFFSQRLGNPLVDFAHFCYTFIFIQNIVLN